MNGFEQDQISCIKCGDFHSVALMENGTVKTWGSGVLGHGNEWYDSRPHDIKFFEIIGRRVILYVIIIYYSISAKAAITGCLATSKDGFTEAYIWGYLRDQNRKLCKALSPVLVKDALKLTELSSIICGYNGSFAILGKNNGQSILQIYNALPERGSDIPYAPLCESVPLIDQVYDQRPTIEVLLHNDTHSISLGSDAAFFVENNVAKLLDYQSMHIHTLDQKSIKIGTLASNSVLLASANSIYSYGFDHAPEIPPKTLTFYEFLLQSLKRQPKKLPIQQTKSTLELLKETPREFKINKPPISLIASYKEFFVLNKE